MDYIARRVGLAHWDERFMNLARYISEWSKERSTTVGVVNAVSENEVRAIGHNGYTNSNLARRKAARGESLRNW